jgi:TolB-like protein
MPDRSAIPSPEAVRDQLARLQRSVAFAGSARLTQFLNFIIDETLERAGQSLKEAVIGNAIYGGHVPYDPRIDSTVRVEARRLRRKLALYYEREGREDPVRVHVPTGSYVPCFSLNIARPAPSPACAPQEDDEPRLLAIMPFIALTPSAYGQSFVDGVTDELIFVAERVEGLRVAPRIAVYQYRRESYTIAQLARDLGARTILAGTLRCVGGLVRVTLELCDNRGFVLWSSRIELSEQDEAHLQDEIVIRAFERLRAEAPLRETTGLGASDTVAALQRRARPQIAAVAGG